MAGQDRRRKTLPGSCGRSSGPPAHSRCGRSQRSWKAAFAETSTLEIATPRTGLEGEEPLCAGRQQAANGSAACIARGAAGAAADACRAVRTNRPRRAPARTLVIFRGRSCLREVQRSHRDRRVPIGDRRRRFARRRSRGRAEHHGASRPAAPALRAIIAGAQSARLLGGRHYRKWPEQFFRAAVGQPDDKTAASRSPKRRNVPRGRQTRRTAAVRGPSCNSIRNQDRV